MKEITRCIVYRRPIGCYLGELGSFAINLHPRILSKNIFHFPFSIFNLFVSLPRCSFRSPNGRKAVLPHLLYFNKIEERFQMGLLRFVEFRWHGKLESFVRQNWMGISADNAIIFAHTTIYSIRLLILAAVSSACCSPFGLLTNPMGPLAA